MRPIFLFVFLLASSFAFGQKIHEIKTDLVLPFVQIAHLGYEFNPEGRLGVEANFWYSWAENGGYLVPPATSFYEAEWKYIPTKQQVLIYTLAGKYYFSRKSNGTGLYLGSYLRQDILVSHRDSRYTYLVLNNYSLPGEDVGGKQALRTGIGALAGYKYLIGKHLIVEAGIGIDLNLLRRICFGDNSDVDWAGIPSVKAGYRF